MFFIPWTNSLLQTFACNLIGSEIHESKIAYEVQNRWCINTSKLLFGRTCCSHKYLRIICYNFMACLHEKVVWTFVYNCFVLSERILILNKFVITVHQFTAYLMKHKKLCPKQPKIKKSRCLIARSNLSRRWLVHINTRSQDEENKLILHNP